MRAVLLALALTAASPACAPPAYVQPTTCSNCPSPPAVSSFPHPGLSAHHYLLLLALTIIICASL